MRMLSVMVCLLMFSGCSLQSSQLSAVMGLLKPQDTELSLNSWSVKYANYGGYNHPHQLRAILMWDVMLTDSEIKDVYDTFPSGAMATWDG